MSIVEDEYCKACGNLLCEDKEGAIFCPYCLGIDTFTEEDLIYIDNLLETGGGV